MAEPILSYELKSLLNNIKSQYLVEFPVQTITLNYLVLAILDNKFCDGHDVLSKLMMDSTLNEFKEYVTERIMMDSGGNIKMTENSKFSEEYDKLAQEIADSGAQVVTSSLMLTSIVLHDKDMTQTLTRMGVTISQLTDAVTQQMTVVGNDNDGIVKPQRKTHKRNKPKKNEDDKGASVVPSKPDKAGFGCRIIPEENNIVEANCTNLVRKAFVGEYDNIIGFDKEIETIFDVLGKCERNTVAIVGARGVGKTSLIERLAKRLYDQDCPKMFQDKYIMQFGDNISSAIIKEMNRQGKYIAFIDDLERLFVNKESEPNNVFVLTELFKTPNVMTIVAMNDTAYAKHIESKPEFARYLNKLTIHEPTEQLLSEILRHACKTYEDYHGVKFTDENIGEAIRLAKRFIVNEQNPRAALNILDASASFVRLREGISEEVATLKQRLKEVESKIAAIPSTASASEFDMKDELTREQISLNKELTQAEKKNKNTILDITVNNIKSVVSEMVNVPVSEMDADEKKKLKSLENNLKAVVVGQNEAINDLVRAVKRQRVGLANPNRPVVMMFVGTTGTGKSFLAKRLAFEMFGDEKNMVRLDMSEYADKTSINKMYGSSPGYVGYEEGGVLTEAIKKNNRCVLLLDEIEKAHEDVFDVLLQVFDEGRLTDNKGTLIDFKNVIIIMTSNVGAKNITDKVATIGFGKHDENQENKEIVLKAIKKTFKPEFINRIDNICYFNKLTDENLRNIISNEIARIGRQVCDLGYKLDESFTDGKLTSSIFENVKKEAEYGARPILREVQQQLVDKLTDFIIDNQVETGYVFKYSDIYK